MSWPVLIFCALCAGVMGFAVQHGATCTVAAVEEYFLKRTFKRLWGFVEASLWVLGGLLICLALGVHADMQTHGFTLRAWGLFGGALLGYGAFVNRSCVFGALARLGNGQLAYLFTPVGYYIGAWLVRAADRHLPMDMVLHHMVLQQDSALLTISKMSSPLLILILVGTLMLARTLHIAKQVCADHSWAQIRQRLWQPHYATIIIGITFLPLMLLAGGWGYTNMLDDIASENWVNMGQRSFLFIALFSGAIFGGMVQKRFTQFDMPPSLVVRCTLGGLLMGVGSALIPGSNDGLILVGMPLLWPYAFAAFAMMVLSIGVSIRLASRQP